MADLRIDLGDLSEGQQLALGTYTSVTNQEPAQAIPLLQRSEWNVQVSRWKPLDKNEVSLTLKSFSDRYRQIL